MMLYFYERLSLYDYHKCGNWIAKFFIECVCDIFLNWISVTGVPEPWIDWFVVAHPVLLAIIHNDNNRSPSCRYFIYFNDNNNNL